MVEQRGAPGRFSATEAAFTGFHLLAREPVTVAVWGAVYLAFTLLVGAGMVVSVGPAMGALVAQQQAGVAADPAASMALMSRLLPYEGVVLIASLAYYALMFAAVNRAVLRPGVGGPGRLALGGDEGRQLLLFVILGVLFFVAYFVLLIVGVVVGVVLGVMMGGAHGAAAGAPPPGPLVAVIAGVVLSVLLALGALFTRLSLASPLTFDTGRIDVFGSWRLTRGIFWPLFGAYLMTWLLMIALFVSAVVVFGLVALAAGRGLAGAGLVFRPDMSSLSGYFQPLMLVWFLIVTVVGTVALAVLMAAPAGAYAQLKALGRAPLAGMDGAPTSAAPVADLPRFGN